MNLSSSFLPGEILLPRGVDLSRWASIACDQFTADPAYWARVEKTVGDSPSTLYLMLPEIYLGRENTEELQGRVLRHMEEYMARDLFRAYPDSYFYIERTLSGGGLRRGLLGLLDLEYYDYRPDSVSPIRATEGLVEDRLPPRLKVRKDALLELPHLILFFDDPQQRVMAEAAKSAGEPLYDTPLMEGGGSVRARRITGEGLRRVREALAALGDEDKLREKYGDASPVLYAVGDGNHSLATAKRIWEELREQLSPADRQTHPARYILAELVDLHEPAIEFEPIHRVLFGTDPADFLRAARERFPGIDGRPFTCLTAAGEVTLTVSGTIGECIGACEAFMEEYAEEHGGTVDYIHGLAEARTLAAAGPDRAGLLMPEMDKADLFPSIVYSGPLPKKSFSIGPARDKRYYLECRKIR